MDVNRYFNYSDYYSMNGIEDTKKNLPILKDDDRTYVYLQGSHFQQNDVIVTNNNNVINIYVVYKLDPISSTRNTGYTSYIKCFIWCYENY